VSLESSRLADRSSSILIAVEGIDGAGKTTQVRMLREALERAGESPVVSKEPTNGPWGKIIKDSATTGRLSPEDELNAFIEDRTQHVNEVIAPALEQGSIVILDRYFYSSIAYQGSRGANVVDIRSLMESRFPIPDAVFVLDVDPAIGVHRIAHSRGEEPNHFEDRSNLAKAREIFQGMTGSNIHNIDGTRSREAVHAEIVTRFIDGPLKAKLCAKSYGCDNHFDCTFRITGTCRWFKLAQAIGVRATT
jgi:dTMP kinase